MNDQRGVYLNKNPEDATLIENKLRKTIGDNGVEFKTYVIVCKNLILVLLVPKRIFGRKRKNLRR